MIYADEIFFMRPNTILTVILPVLQENDTCLISTTTPGNPEHVLSKMINTKDDDGEYILNTVRIGEPCAECEKNKVMLCTHVGNAQPEGTSRTKRTRYMKFYENGLEDLARQEFEGVQRNMNARVFEQLWIDNLRARDRLKLEDNVPFLLMTMDPAQGGSCEFATIVSYFDVGTGKVVIVFMDADVTNGRPAEIRSRIRRMIETVRDIPQLAHTPIVVACESAPPLFAACTAEAVAELAYNQNRNIHVLTGKDGRPGVPKTDTNTREMEMMSSRLMQYGHVAFSDRFTTIDIVYSKKEMIDKFLNTLPYMQRKVIMRTDGTQRVKVTGKGVGCPNDDLTVAFMMIPYWYDNFMISSKPEDLNFKNIYNLQHQFAIRMPKNDDVSFFASKPALMLKPPKKRRPIQIGVR